jgi:hypothetical protein
MIGRGKYNDVYLYEVTEQDLLLDDELSTVYHAGTVLMFADRRGIELGGEFARGEDLAAAKEYLDHRGRHDNQQGSEHEIELAALTSQITARDENLQDLTEKIEQRDELLRDLSENLKSQRQDNELLHAQLEQARAQLAVNEIRHNELVGDLQHVSEETHTIESTLERVMEEKFKLEQELAERITELVELDLQNDDLRKQIINPRALLAETAAPMPLPTTTVSDGVAEKLSDHPESETAAADSDSQVLTMSSGKKIHVLHEFPTAPRQSASSRVSHALGSGLRIAAIALFAVLLLGVASVVTTAQANNISYGEALDLVMKSLGFA